MDWVKEIIAWAEHINGCLSQPIVTTEQKGEGLLLLGNNRALVFDSNGALVGAQNNPITDL